ncbi:amino acid transporter-like protein [Thermoascus aurantiacus ATCC 26904]
MHDIPRTSRTFNGDSLSTAASPLLSTTLGEVICRSPRTPRARRQDEVNHADPGYLKPASSALTVRDDLSADVKQALASSTTHDVNGRGQVDTRRDSWDERSWANVPLTPCLLTSVDEDKTHLGAFSVINIIIGKTVGVGVFSVPASIFVGVGSIGMSILMWVLGALISFCGLAVYLDLGTAIPRSGGERVYLERIFRRPYMLATCMFAAYVVLLGFSAPNCIVLGEYAVYIAGSTPNGWNTRSVAIAAITLSCFVHARVPRIGMKTINLLGIAKMLIMVLVVILGFISMFMGKDYRQQLQNPSHSNRHSTSGTRLIPETTAQRNFADIWSGSSTQPYDYATALLKVLYCFRGYSTANQVLSEVRDPTRTLRVAAPIALALVSVAYILVNISYFLVVEREDFKASGVVVGAHFFRNIFGPVLGERILPLLIILSAYGNIAATSFAQARVNEELGKDGLLPFRSFWSADRDTAMDAAKPKPPVAGLFLHWLVSVIVILVPPGEIYAFLVDIGGYPVSVISVSIAAGLLYLHRLPAELWVSPSSAHYRARTGYVLIFLVANCVLLILPWISPVGGKGDDSFPYFAYPATGLAVLASGGIYWIGWTWWTGRSNNDMQAARAVPTFINTVPLSLWQRRDFDIEIQLMRGSPEDDEDSNSDSRQSESAT